MVTEVRGSGWAVAGRWAERGALGVVLFALAFVGGDWAGWRMQGRPMGSVEVTRMVVAPLKGNREEYYPDGTEVVSCSRSALPWGGRYACWWRERRQLELER